MIIKATALTWIIIFLSDVRLSFSSPYSSQSHPLLIFMMNQHDNQNYYHRLNGGHAMITPIHTGFDDELFVPSSKVNFDLDSRIEISKDIPAFVSPSTFIVEDSSNNGIITSVFDQGKDEIRLAMNFPRPHEQHDELFTNAKRTYLKTGTTIVGVQTRNGIVLAADTRATEGSVVADTRCEKVHQLCQNVWCCGAGTSGDLDALTRKVRYTFLLKTKIRDTVGNGGPNDDTDYDDDAKHRFDVLPFQSEEERDINQNLGKVGVATICHFIREELVKGRGQIGANLVLGGVDPFTDRPVLVAIHPHGSIDVVPYTALGSGGLAAMGVLESRYHVDMTMEEGIELVKSAVLAGIKNDLGSGSQVDLIIIKPDEVKYQRGVVMEEELVFSEDDDAIEKELFRRHAFSSESNKVIIGGVNGFGSLPYQIKSRKTIIVDESIAVEKGNEWLSKILNE
mmetsp:Transcript_8247/g.15531  ORF Transcript_8247/g.15531 Transcript_8247/m.15531 type:complete len:452 (+) Transcript_8247:85-1440(+)